MTNTELIQAIRNEIERRMDKHWEGLPNADAPEDDWTHNELCELGAYKELEHLETFLSTLDSEKPMEQEDIDTEIGHWIDRLDDKYCLLVPHYSIQDIKDTARHFAQWGAEHAKK